MDNNEAEKFTFIVSDESVNKYGYRVLTGGIDTTEFQSNPVMFFNHHRSDDYTGLTGLMPVGRWENLRVDENGRLLADAVIDRSDELGEKLYNKVKSGFMKAASIGIGIDAISDNPDDLVAGQTRGTVTKSVLQEISIVDIPANSNAMKLSFIDETFVLNNTENIEKLNNKLPIVKHGARLGSELSDLIDAYAEANEMTIEAVQDAAGESAGISGDTVSGIKSGEIDCPPLERLESLAGFFGVSVSSLVDAAEADGCDYSTEEKSTEETATVADAINHAFNNMFDKLKSFMKGEKSEVETIDAVEENTPVDAIETLKSEIENISVNVVSVPDSETLTTLSIIKEEIQGLKETNIMQAVTIDALKAELKAIKGQKTNSIKGDDKPVSGKLGKGQDKKQTANAGAFFKNRFNK